MPKEIMILGRTMFLCITDGNTIFNMTKKEAIMSHASLTMSLKCCMGQTSHIPIQWAY